MALTRKSFIILSVVGCAIVIAVTIILVVIFTTLNSCSVAEVPSGLTIQTSFNRITIFWHDNQECESMYHLKYELDDEPAHELNLTQSPFTIDYKLQPCMEIRAYLWTIIDERYSEGYASASRKELPPTEATMSFLSVVSSDEGMLITWQRAPEIAKCTGVQYTADITTDIGIFRQESTEERIEIPASWYCFTSNITLATWMDYKLASTTMASQSGAAGNVTIEQVDPETNPDEFLVSWITHRTPDCAYNHVVSYLVNGVALDLANTIDPEVRLNFTSEICVRAQLIIRVVSIYGSTTTTEVDATRYPSNISAVLNFSERDEAEETISFGWDEIPGLAKCDVRYRVDIKSDIGNFSFETRERNTGYLGSYYCYTFELEIRPIVNQVIGNPSGFEFTNSVISPVQNLTLNPPEMGDPAWIVRWAHIKEATGQCDIRYEMTLTRNSETVTFPVITSTVLFLVENCTGTVSVTVVAISGGRVSEGRSVSRDCIDF